MKKNLFSKIITVLLALVLVFSITACDDGNGELDLGNWRDLSVRQATGANGVVASANSYASKAGVEILHAGGNAFDAAVAVSFALGVVEPNASGVGGGGLMVAYEAKTGKNHFYDFREFSPRALNPDTFIGADKLRTSGVPTQTVGLLTILEDLGSGNITRQRAMEAAIDYAENGFTIDKELAQAMDNAKITAQTLKNPQIKEIFTDGFAPLGQGDTLVQTDYANVLKEISNKGIDGFYKGWVADALLDTHLEFDGLLTQDDLDYAVANFPRKSEPLKTTYNGYEVLTVDLPSAGGVGVIEALNMLEYYGNKSGVTKLKDLDPYSTEYLHLVSSAMQLSYGDRRAYVGDYNINPLTNQPYYTFANINNNGNPLPALTNKDFAKERWDGTTRSSNGVAKPPQKFDPTTAFMTTTIGPTTSDPGCAGSDLINKYLPGTATSSVAIEVETDDGSEGSSTTTFSITDKAGNIVSITQTVNSFWGEGFVPVDCGFFLNNNLNGFSSTATSHVRAAPYRQSLASMAPTIVLKDGKPYATYGTPGGLRIAGIVLQMTLYLLDHEMGMQEAIEMGRIYNYAGTNANNKKQIEVEDLIGATAIAGLEGLNYHVVPYEGRDLYFGGVQGIKFNYDASGKLVNMTGGADPRRDGKALAY